MGLTGARESHVDPVSSLQNRIILSKSRHLTKEPEFRLPFFRSHQRLISSEMTLCWTQVFLSITLNHPLTFCYVDQRHIVASIKKNMVLVLLPYLLLCAPSPSPEPLSCICCHKLPSLLHLPQWPLGSGHLTMGSPDSCSRR